MCVCVRGGGVGMRVSGWVGVRACVYMCVCTMAVNQVPTVC